MFNVIQHKICENNYHKKIQQLKNRKNAINVIFLSFENEKWGYQSLYDLLSKDERFNPIVLVGITSYKHKEKNVQFDLERNYNFFKSRGINVDYIYKDNKYLDLQSFSPDIVFYEQQWGLPKKLRPQVVSKYALTYYCAYSFQLFNYESDYMQKFHSFLYKFFTDSICNIERYESYHTGNSKNCVAVGYSKLDEYLENKVFDINKYWKEPKKFKIIYSPHHSFTAKGLRMGTFKENGQFILNLAKNNPDTTWIFKPHPRLKTALVKNNIMTETEIEEYYKSWENVGRVYTQGDYINIFKIDGQSEKMELVAAFTLEESKKSCIIYKSINNEI